MRAAQMKVLLVTVMLSSMWQVACKSTTCTVGLLASGIIPVVKHCLDNLLTTNARAIPASATVYAQVGAFSSQYPFGVENGQ